MIKINIGVVYQDSSRPNRLFKLLDLIKSDNRSGHNQSTVVIYREVYPDITYHLDGDFLLEYEFVKDSTKIYMQIEEFVDVFKNFEVDKETLIRIREGIYD